MAGADAAAKAQKSTRLVDRDVEAPEVFQVTDERLGRAASVWAASGSPRPTRRTPSG